MASQQHVRSALILALQTFCQEEMGMQPRRVKVNLGHDAIMVLLEQALSPAEMQTAQSKEGAALLKAYEERLLDAARPRLQMLVEEAVKRQVTSTHVHADVYTGNVIGFFVLAEE
ncbi:MAG: Na-translocating system protein MpsC family protein [Anaerolineae bacterium]